MCRTLYSQSSFTRLHFFSLSVITSGAAMFGTYVFFVMHDPHPVSLASLLDIIVPTWIAIAVLGQRQLEKVVLSS